MNEQIQEKLAEILGGMDKFNKFNLKKNKLMDIDRPFIERKMGVLNKTLNGVFSEYMKSFILRSIKVNFT